MKSEHLREVKVSINTDTKKGVEGVTTIKCAKKYVVCKICISLQQNSVKT